MDKINYFLYLHYINLHLYSILSTLNNRILYTAGNFRVTTIQTTAVPRVLFGHTIRMYFFFVL